MFPVPFLRPSEIDQRMENELIRFGFRPDSYEATLDVEAFLTQYLKAVLEKDASLPNNVMGEVTFRPNRRPYVNINVDLTVQAEGAEFMWQLGRWRMTVAHESAHIILHGPLYLPTDQLALWDDDEPRVHRCYKKDNDWDSEAFLSSHGWNSGRLINESSQIQAMEFQANRAAAALLMPRQSFIELGQKISDSEREKFSHLSVSLRKKRVVTQIAAHFQVSEQAARIRCMQLNILERLGQERLI